MPYSKASVPSSAEPEPEYHIYGMYAPAGARQAIELTGESIFLTHDSLYYSSTPDISGYMASHRLYGNAWPPLDNIPVSWSDPSSDFDSVGGVTVVDSGLYSVNGSACKNWNKWNEMELDAESANSPYGNLGENAEKLGEYSINFVWEDSPVWRGSDVEDECLSDDLTKDEGATLNCKLNLVGGYIKGNCLVGELDETYDYSVELLPQPEVLEDDEISGVYGYNWTVGDGVAIVGDRRGKTVTIGFSGADVNEEYNINCTVYFKYSPGAME